MADKQNLNELLRNANVLRRQGDLRGAYKSYRRILASKPNQPEALNNGGIVAFQLGRTDEALQLLTTASDIDPGNAEAHTNLAMALLALGYSEKASAACRRATVLNPQLFDAHVNLGHALMDLEQPLGAAEAYEKASKLRPNGAEIHFQLGMARHASGALDEAVSALEKAAALEPTSGRALYGLGNVFQTSGQLEKAIEAYRGALNREPTIAKQVFGVGKPRHIHALLSHGDAAGARSLCYDYLKDNPGDSCALAHLAIAHNELGDNEALHHLYDFDRLVQHYRPHTPKPHRDIAAFNKSLETHIRSHPSLINAPSSFSVEGGQTTGELLTKPLGPMNAFQRIIHDAVENYISELPNDPSHPFIARTPKRWKATVWAIIIGPNGHQVPHIHPSGWLSAVYYVNLPTAISVPDSEDHGWIEFGKPYKDVPFSTIPPTRRVRPEEGLMLMFPSYLYHRTITYPGAEDRISISFDILPLN